MFGWIVSLFGWILGLIVKLVMAVIGDVFGFIIGLFKKGKAEELPVEPLVEDTVKE